MARLALTSEPIKIVHILLSGFLLTLNLANAGPTAQRSTPKCLSFCTEARNFQYESGVTYVYDYSTDIRTSLIEGSDQTSHVRVTAKVEVESSSKCDLKLQLKNVHFEDLTSGPSEYAPVTDPTFFRTQEAQLEKHSLLFGFQDGKVEQICAHQDEDIWALNVKRGVISMLQNSLENLSPSSNIIHEIDINGRCPTVYVWEGEAWGGGISYKKLKDLSQCTSRQSQLSAIQSVTYSSSSPIQNIPLLKGNVECVQTIRNNRIENVLCKEEQKFKPFEQRNSGAVTAIAQILNYVSEHRHQQRRTEDYGVLTKKGLLFESEEPIDGEQDNMKTLQQILEHLEQASFPQVKPTAPQLFVDLVDELRRSNERSIRATFDQTFGTTRETYVMEALPVVGTASSLAILRDLTLQGILPIERTNAWLTALAFIKQPTLQMIKVVTPLLDEPSMEGMLGISSLVNSYCKYHSSCNQDIVVNAVLEKFTSYLGRSCQPERTGAQDVRQMVLRLKAIGNAGVLPVAEEVSRTSVIVRCFKETTNPAEIRLAAIDSLRRLSCSAYNNQEIIQLFINVHENTEVRIKAFLALMRCTNRDTMELVKSVLFTEPVNQVASFVWTYLTNLQETNRPQKQQIRDLVSNEFLKNKYSTDARKFSRNYEVSQYWPDINVGGGIDSNVIFTEESFLPKSGMLNLTLQLFGESVNVLEFGVRSQGLEHLLEKVFGPQGYFPDNRVADFLDNNRVKRDTSSNDETEGLGYLYDQARPDEEQIPGGSIYTRMFGHEVLYKSFEVSTKTPIPNVVDDSGQSWFNIRSILDNLSTGKKTEFRKSMILLDTTYSVATSSGFPLSLGVHAAATMAVKAKGKFNVGRYLETKELEIEAALQPSTTVNVDGTLAIKIGKPNEQFRTGLKLHNTLSSSTAVEINLVVKGNKVVHASVNIPQERQEIIDVSSQLMFIGPNGEAPLQTAPSDTSVAAYASRSCTSNSTSEIVGMRLCLEMNIPSEASFTPLQPIYLKASLEKTDTFTGYTFDYRYASDHSATKLNAVFDTPGSRVNRRIAGNFLFDRGMGKIAAGFDGTSTIMRAEGIYTQFHKNLELSLVSREKTSFLLSAGITNDANVLKPHFLMTWHGRPLVDLKGTIDTTPQPNNTEKTSVELNLKHLTQSPVKVVGEITGSGEDKQATLTIESYIVTGSIHSKLIRKPGHWRTKTTVQYSYKGEKEQTAELRAKIQRERKGSLTTSVVSFGLTSTEFPDMNFSWETQTSAGFCENKLNIGWGKTNWNGHTLFSRQNQGDHSELRLETSLACSKFKVDYRLEFGYLIVPEGFNTKFLARVGADNELKANVDYESSVRDLFSKSLKAGVIWPNTEYSVKASFLEKARGKFEGQILVHLNQSRELKATAVYTNNSTNLKLDHEIQFRARGFTTMPISGSISFSAIENQSHIGCQIQFEGQKPYSRISTSLDYSHTKNSHKLDGKVTLNEKKYNGELLYVVSSSGGKNLTIDLQLENHIFMQGTLNGMLPQPMSATFLIVPDRDNSPTSRMKIEGQLDPYSIGLFLDYFGEEMSFAGRYDESSVLAEVTWPEDNKFMIALAVPQFELSNAQFELDVITPFDGYNTITFTAKHEMEGVNWKCNINGGIEDTTANLNLSGTLSMREASVAAALDLTGYPSYLGNILLLRMPKRKSFQVAFKQDEQEAFVDFDFTRLDEGYLGKFEVNGCKFLPEVSMEVNHQFSASHVSSYHNKVQWATDGAVQNVVLLVKHQNHPLSVEATFTSPWTPVKHMEGSLTWDPARLPQQISFTLGESSVDIKSRAELNLVGNMQDFNHEMKGEWYSQTMRLTLSGGFNGISDSSLHTILRLPDNHISFDLLSKKGVGKYIGEFKADLNAAVTSGGLKWDFSSETTSTPKLASVWGQAPSISPASATFEYDNTGNKRLAKMKVSSSNISVLDVDSEWDITGLRLWNTTLILKSTLLWLPSIELTSENNMIYYKNIRHATSLKLIPVDEDRFWLNNFTIPIRHVSADVLVENLEDISGTAIVGETDFSVTGKIQKEGDVYSSNVKIESNRFHEMSFQGTYMRDSEKLVTSGSLINHAGETLIRIQVDTSKGEEEQTGKFMVSSAYTPSFEGFVGLTSSPYLGLSLYLLKNQENLFTFNSRGTMVPSMGNVLVTLTSTSFPSIAHIQLDFDYKVATGGMNGNMKFEDNGLLHLANVELVWGEETRHAKISYDGATSFSFEASVDGMKSLLANVIYKGRKLGELTVSYQPEQSDFQFGKHGVYLTLTDSDAVSKTLNVIVGVDPKKVFLNVQTPFTNWTDVLINGRVGSTPSSKTIKFLLQRKEESITGSFESKTSRKTGSLQLVSELSVIGFSSLREILLETVQATEMEGLSALSPQKFLFNLTWAPTNINVKVETPVDVLKSLSLAGNWEYKKPQKFINLAGNINDQTYDIKVEMQTENNACNGKLIFVCSGVYSLNVVYDLSKDYEAQLTLSTPNRRLNFAGEISIQENSLGIKLTTPFQNFESISVSASRENPTETSGIYTLSWDINGNADKVGFQYTFEAGNIELRAETPIQPWNSVVVTIIHDTPFKRLTFHSQRGDGKEIKVSFAIDTTGNMTVFESPASSSILVAIETPVEHFEDIKFSLLYDRKNFAHIANISVSRSSGETEGKLNMMYQQSQPVSLDISAYLTSPALTSKATAHASLLVDPSGESTVSAHVQANGKRYEMYGLYQLTDTHTKFEMRTTLPFLRQVRLALKKADTMGMQVFWNGNNKVVEINGNLLCGGLRSSRASFNVSTPVDVLGSLAFEGDINSKPGSTIATIRYQNHEVRWFGKLQRFQASGTEDWRLQVNTPLVGFKHVVVSMKHFLSSAERNVIGVVQLNKKELAMKISLKRHQLSMTLSSELSYLPIQSRIDADWENELLLKIETSTGNHEYGTTANLDLQGISQGKLAVAISALEHLDTRLDWQFEGDGNRGQGLINLKNPVIGRKSLRSNWVNRNWQEVHVEGWMTTGVQQQEKGISLQYVVTPHQHYGSVRATATYTFTEEPQTIVFEGKIDENSSHIIFDSMLRTPHEDLQLFEIKGQLTMNSEIGFKVNASLNEELVIDGDLTLFVTPLQSGIQINLDLPMILDPLKLDASYDLSSENKLVSLKFKQIVYLIDLKLSVNIPPRNGFMDVNLQAESNVPAMPLDVSGNLKMEHAVSQDGTRQVSVHLKHNKVGEWKLMGSIRASANLHCKVVFDGPKTHLPILMFEFNFRGNLRQGISSDVTVIVNNSELTGNLLVSCRQWLTNFKCSVGSVHYTGDAQVNFEGNQSTIEVRYNGDQNYSFHVSGAVNVTAKAKVGSGTVTITSGSNSVVPLALEIIMENEGSMRIVGRSHEKNVKIDANLNGVNGSPWATEGTTALRVEGDLLGNGNVEYSMQSTHFIRSMEYSFNATVNELYSTESYMRTGRNAALYINTQGLISQSSNTLNVRVEPSTVDVYVKVPGWVNGQLLGDYGSTSDTAFFNGILHLNKYKSIFNTSVSTEGNQTRCKAILELPSIKQKVDLEITTTTSGPQSLGGLILLKLNDQEFQISGHLKSKTFDSTRGERYIERLLQLSGNFSSVEITNTGLQLFIQKPIKSYSNLNIIGTLNVNDQMSTISGGYDLPTQNTSSAGLYLKLKSSLLPSEENYEFFLKSFGVGLKKVEGKMNFKLTKFDILWDFVMPTSVVSVGLTGRSDGGDKMFFQVESIFNPNEIVQLSLNCHCSDTEYTFRTSLTRTGTAVVGQLYVDAPPLFDSANEYKISVSKNTDGSYTMEASAVRGRLILELAGDASLTLNNISVVLKAMGSYGSHYADIAGSRNEDGYAVEITMESSSLLVDKRINVRGTLGISDEAINANIQCRARRNIHELSISLLRGEGTGKLAVSLESPTLDPAKLDAEWVSREKFYFGQLKVEAWKKVHQSEFGINLENFEGKLHIISPLLPSNEFNFHVKSIVNTENLNVLGDIKIRGSHWRLEGIASFFSLRNMTFKIETRTSFEFIDRITLGIKCTPEEVYLEIHTPATHVPNLMFRLGGLQSLEQGLWHKLKPKLILSLPNEKYSAEASVELPTYENMGVIHVSLQHIANSTEAFEFGLAISPLKTFKLQMEDTGNFEIKLITPFEILRRVGLHIEGEINNRRSGKLLLTSYFNSYDGKFDASFDNSNGNMQAATRLITNVPGYEKSAFAIAIEAFQGIGNGKSFHVEFRKPDWENLFRVDADYRYIFESFTELEGEINVNLDSYMNLPSLHAHLKSGMKQSRYRAIIEGKFGAHQPSLKVETTNTEEKITVIVEGKAGANDSYILTNALEVTPFQNNFTFKEKLHYNEWQVVGMEASLSDLDELFECYVNLNTPWGPVNSAVALTSITMLTMSQALSLPQLMKNTNVTVDVRFKNKKLVGLEIVSKDGMRMFEIQNPIRPVSLSLGVEKVGWNAFRMKAGVCWDLKVPETSSLGINAYMYKRSTGLDMGFFLAGAKYGIINANFEHYLISSKLKQNLKIQWNAHSGRNGDIGYTLNLTDRSTVLKRQMDYEFTVVVPSRSVLIYGGSTSQDKNRVVTMAVAWDAARDADKVLSFNVSSTKSTTWRTSTESNAIKIQHFAWSEPIVFSMQKQLIHDSMRQFELKFEPSSKPSDHFSISSTWDNGDWTSLLVAVSQPATKVDIQATYNITENYKLIKFNYMLFNGESKMAAVILDKSMESQKLMIQSGDSVKPRTVASVTTQVSSVGHSVKGEILKYQIAGNVRTSLPYLDLTLFHENVNKLHIVCGLPHPKEIVFKATRSQLRKTIQDLSLLVRLNSSSLLSTRVNWRPEVFDEIQDYDWLKGSRNFINDLLPSFLEVSTAIRTEIDGHWNLVSPPVKQFISSLYHVSAYEINLLWEEAQEIGLRLQKLYADNAFYVKDMLNIIQTSLSPLLRIFETISVRAKELCQTACYYLMNAGKMASNTILKYYGHLEELVIGTWDEMDKVIINFWRNNLERIENLLQEPEEWIDSLVEALEGKIDMLESKLMAVGFIKNLISIYRDYATWMDELPIDDYVTAIEDFFQIKVWDRLAEIFGPYLESIRNAMDDEYLQELLETPPIPYIRFVLKQTKNAFVRLWDLIELEKKAKDLIRHALRNIDGLMQRNFPTWELDWDFYRGIIQYDQSLSFIHWVDFTQSPQWSVNAQEEKKVNQITNMYYQILDYIENLKPVFDMRIRDILPPFGGLAMMAGDYHYYTFDKKYFRFAGECSYVLVAYLLHNGFSFIVNYQSRDGAIRKKSYSIALKNNNIEFDAETFKVTVDSKKVELPAKVGTLYIRRQETRLDVYDTRGYQITCTLSPSVCTFSTSGWYYGKLAGLLGTFDNEPINDFRSPDGQIISDIPTFAYSWRVGKHRNQCRMKNFAKKETESDDVDNICYDLLANRASPLRPCFNTVDTTIFMEMCKYDISKNINNANRAESACISMSAYVTECQKHNVDVWMPPTCIRCKLEDGSAFTTGENVTLETNGVKQPPSSTDVVILLEERECVNQINLTSTIAKLESSLRAEGIFDNRYAIIGFGGQGIHYDPHIQTSSANVWSHSTLFRAPDTTNITGVRKSDLYSAIHFATTMLYRAGVSKTLIAITCGDEKCGDSARYSETLTHLTENDFKLHMLTPKPISLKGKKRQDETNRIFGFDTNGVYTLQHAKRGTLVADPSYKRQLNLPKDLCTPMAVETNGSRFSTDNMSKKMLDVWSRRVSQSAHPSKCQRCECLPNKNGGSRLTCYQCVSPSIWKFMEEWKNYQSEEIDDTYGLEILDTDALLLSPN